MGHAPLRCHPGRSAAQSRDLLLGGPGRVRYAALRDDTAFGAHQWAISSSARPRVGGALGAFGFIAAAMLVVVVSVSLFGPPTRGLALEEIAS
jgi:hypothetical protein